MYILLDLPKKEDIPKISYIRILGANESGKKLISNASLPVITSLSKARDTLTEDARALALIEEKTTAAFSLSLKNRTAQNEYSQKPIGF